MAYALAAGIKIDTNKVEPFGKQVDEVYSNPFKGTPKELTAEEIKQQVVAKLLG